MIPAIFQPEITTLESQVAALQAQLAAAQQRIALLNETELLAGGSLEALKGAIAKVTALAPDAIASLKSAVLNLFTGSDDSSDGGNQPDAPEPEPGNDGGEDVAINPTVLEELDAIATDSRARQNELFPLVSNNLQSPGSTKTIYASSSFGFVKRTTAASYKYWQLVVTATHDGYLLGQFSFSSKPVVQSKQKDVLYIEVGTITDALPKTVELKKSEVGGWRGWIHFEPSCEWASPLASPFACQLEDCPSTALTGQFVQLPEEEEEHALPWHELPFDFERGMVIDEIEEPDYEKFIPVDLTEVGSMSDMDALIDAIGAAKVAQMYTEASLEQRTTVKEYYPGIDAIVRSEIPEQDASIKLEVEPEMPYVELIQVSDRVSYQRRQDGEIICCYLAGNNKNRLKDWGSWLCTQHSVGSGFEVRKAERLTAYNHELKIWGMSLKQIRRLAETDTTKTPPSRYHVASFPVAANLLQSDEDVPQAETEQVVVAMNRDVEEIPATAVCAEQEALPDLQGFKVGDKVEVTSDRHGVELVGTSGIVTAGTAAGAAVNVGGTLRWFCSDEAVLVEASPQPRNAADDLFPTTPAPTYNANPIGRGGAAANWKARQAAGIGVNLKDCGTGGITTLEEWRQIEAEQKAQKAIAVVEEPEIQEGDWVELLVNGDRYQVDSVDSEGIHLVTEDGNACVEVDEVKFLFRAPADWKPF